MRRYLYTSIAIITVMVVLISIMKVYFFGLLALLFVLGIYYVSRLEG